MYAASVPPSARARRSPFVFAVLLVFLLVAEANDLATTLILADRSGHGFRDEWNPAAALAWANYGPLGLVAFKAVMTLWALLAIVLAWRLGRWHPAGRPLAMVGTVAGVLWYVGLTLWHVLQMLHLPGYFA